MSTPASADHKIGHVGSVVVAPTDEGFATGIFIPGGGDGAAADAVRRAAARCDGCSFHRVPSCEQNGFLGYDPVSGAAVWKDDVACARFATSCGTGAQRWDVYLRRPGESAYRRIGEVCMPTGSEPVTFADLAAALYREFEQHVPPATFAVQPLTAHLVNVPAVVYATGQDVPSPTYRVRGIEVRLTLYPEYAWDFGDGAVVESGADPGRPYAGDSAETIHHTYVTPGVKQVRLTATWRASFTAFGETFTVPQAVVRRSPPRELVVREARAQLEDG